MLSILLLLGKSICARGPAQKVIIFVILINYLFVFLFFILSNIFISFLSSFKSWHYFSDIFSTQISNKNKARPMHCVWSDFEVMSMSFANVYCLVSMCIEVLQRKRFFVWQIYQLSMWHSNVQQTTWIWFLCWTKTILFMASLNMINKLLPKIIMHKLFLNLNL